MNFKREHFRGVVWPHGEQPDAQGKPTYRYVLVGMLVTDEPIPGLDPNETVIDGTMRRYVGELGMAGAIGKLPKFKASQALGDATNVLLSLEDIVGEPIPEPKPSRIRKAA